MKISHIVISPTLDNFLIRIKGTGLEDEETFSPKLDILCTVGKQILK